MQKLIVLLGAVLLLTACGNNKTETSTETKSESTTTKKDSTSTDGNTVTPPASNGQY
jgi:ABC-type oligopeptide transport system substrate-binding subunit